MADLKRITVDGVAYNIAGSGGGGGGAVDSVNGQTGDVVLDAEDVGALPDNTVIPTKTSDLTNDSGFLTSAPVASVNGETGAVVLDADDVGAEAKITEVTIATAGAVTQALDANKICHFTGALTSLTITLNAVASGVAQYHFDFLSGSTAPTLTMPNTVTMPDSFAVEANKRYEVDVLNNYGAVISWANS